MKYYNTCYNATIHGFILYYNSFVGIGNADGFFIRVKQTHDKISTQKGQNIMTITKVHIRRTFTEGRLKAVVSVTLDDCIAIHELKIIQGNDRLFVAMPSRMDVNGEYRDIIHPIGTGVRRAFEQVVLKAYESCVSAQEISA